MGAHPNPDWGVLHQFKTFLKALKTMKKVKKGIALVSFDLQLPPSGTWWLWRRRRSLG